MLFSQNMELDVKKSGFVTKSKCWLKNLLMRRAAERRPNLRLTVERLEKILHSTNIDLHHPSGHVGMQDIAIHRILDKLHLSHEEIARREPRVYQNLLRTCLECAHSEKCSRGFEKRQAFEIWPNYCPNAMTLKAMLN